MRVGRFECGLIKPYRWYAYKGGVESCGCTIYTFGFWYFTILRNDCL